MTDQDKAVQEGERIAAADEYFKARTWIMDTNDNRRIFEAGFDRAYALLSALRAPVADEPTKPRPPMLRIPGVREDVLRRAAERITSAPVAEERISDETLWSWATQVMGGPEAHRVGMDRVLRYARMLLASAPVADILTPTNADLDAAFNKARISAIAMEVSAPVADERAVIVKMIDDLEARAKEAKRYDDFDDLGTLRLLVWKASAPVADERAAFSRAEISFPLTIPENRVYLAGPMTGYEDHNFPAFRAAAERLRGHGLEVVNPADHGLVTGLGWSDYMRWDLVKLAGCHAVYVLPGWEKSKGASLEVSIARALGLPVFTVGGAPLASAPVAEPYDSERRCRAYYDSDLRPFAADGLTYNVWQAVWHAAQFDRAMTPDSSKPRQQSAPVAGEAQERIEQMALSRYRTVPCGQFSHKVVAGDGARSLHVGPKGECLEVAAHLTEAFLDGAFVASSAAPQASEVVCSCPSGDGSLRHPCAVHGGFKEQRSGPDQTLFTYSSQPCRNEIAWRFGEACSKAAHALAGDYIDRGLVLLKELQAKGYGIAALSAQPGAQSKENES